MGQNATTWAAYKLDATINASVIEDAIGMVLSNSRRIMEISLRGLLFCFS